MTDESLERWGGWGDPAKAAPLPEKLRLMLGVQGHSPGVPLADVTLPPTRIDVSPLAAIVGGAHVHTDVAARARFGTGKSTADLLRQRAGELPTAPDAVVRPGSHDEVLAVLAFAAKSGLYCVPHGGKTSVVGGLAPAGPASAGIIAVDLTRMNALLNVDQVSRTATLQAGVRAPEAERLLAEHGLTLGHFPQSFEYATIGGFAATRSSGQASAGFGRFDAMVVGLTVATPRGTIETGRAPASAAGPDLRQLFLGSEGAFGIITAVTVRVRPVHELTYHGWRVESFADGLDIVRKLAQDGPLPAVLRLSDEMETMLQHSSDGCLLITGSQMPVTIDGATALGPTPGEKWLAGRYEGPYLRDSLLDAGAFVETLETAAFWSRIPALYEAVRTAITDTAPCFVLCHVSHVYETGASLYFTIVSPSLSLDEWATVKAAANDAILNTGGTITHHHGIGTDHRDWYVQEAGALAIEALQAVKRTLDPAGVLNPGILLPPS